MSRKIAVEVESVREASCILNQCESSWAWKASLLPPRRK